MWVIFSLRFTVVRKQSIFKEIFCHYYIVASSGRKKPQILDSCNWGGGGGGGGIDCSIVLGKFISPPPPSSPSPFLFPIFALKGSWMDTFLSGKQNGGKGSLAPGPDPQQPALKQHFAQNVKESMHSPASCTIQSSE